jgi:hypothetical protein
MIIVIKGANVYTFGMMWADFSKHFLYVFTSPQNQPFYQIAMFYRYVKFQNYEPNGNSFPFRLKAQMSCKITLGFWKQLRLLPGRVPARRPLPPPLPGCLSRRSENPIAHRRQFQILCVLRFLLIKVWLSRFLKVFYSTLRHLPPPQIPLCQGDAGNETKTVATLCIGSQTL